jgi:CarD family transcriptional regulator
LKKNDDLTLEIGDLVVYPIYGVGEIEDFDTYNVDGSTQDFILINFKQDKMKLRIPKDKASNSGLRKLSNKNRLSKALEVLAEKPAVKKDMWIKRAKEYEKNINSGDPVLIAEVVRDLHKKEDSLEQQSYSERQIYLTALNRLSNEYAAVQNLDKKAAKVKLEELLNQ